MKKHERKKKKIKFNLACHFSSISKTSNQGDKQPNAAIDRLDHMRH